MAICPLSKPTSCANQERNKKIPPPNDADSQVHVGRRIAGTGSDAIFTGPPHCFALDAHRALVFITRVTTDSLSVQIRSDWNIRETIVSGVSSAPTTDRWPPLPRPTLRRRRVRAPHYLQGFRSSNKSPRLSS